MSKKIVIHKPQSVGRSEDTRKVVVVGLGTGLSVADMVALHNRTLAIQHRPVLPKWISDTKGFPGNLEFKPSSNKRPKLISNVFSDSEIAMLESIKEPKSLVKRSLITFPRNCGKTALVDAIKEMKMDHNPTEALKSAFETPSIINKHF